MIMLGLGLFICLLVLPALLCCSLGGWYLVFGLAALGCWLFLLGLIGVEFWRWYKNPNQDQSENP